MIFDVLSLFAIVFSFMAFGVSVWCLIELRAMQKSTHQIQYVPADGITDEMLNKDISSDKIGKIQSEFDENRDGFSKDFDNVI